LSIASSQRKLAILPCALLLRAFASVALLALLAAMGLFVLAALAALVVALLLTGVGGFVARTVTWLICHRNISCLPARAVCAYAARLT
jgi:hypothetical protein